MIWKRLTAYGTRLKVKVLEVRNEERSQAVICENEESQEGFILMYEANAYNVKQGEDIIIQFVQGDVLPDYWRIVEGEK